MNLLKAEKIVKSYQESEGKLVVLDEVDLEVNKGEMSSITGESGSGKSTLLHLLGMLDSPDSGEIYYFEKLMKVNAKNINEFRNQKIGFVFQFHYLLEDFTAEENVAMPMFLATKNFGKSLKKSREILKQLSLYDRRDHYPNQLSGGEQQRVAVARALINQPEIVFADEPTGNLDANHSEELINLLIDMNKRFEQTFVLATHNQEIAAKMQNHYHLQNGKMIDYSQK
ncbi:MAG: ABC transporter ATP-binding protein [Candidatus Cloacimonetes bacterium]|nr:ABC transporter ATP-binding protein [Candidatus Cloacimonadota bacterium]MCF7812924.1 ABC transporter ATP-binding protein [Candidatus Cloacimonadota bacterium]MCF7867136.1 ABC transporter ATP-binding protein [Candidatus Cloacimonadota bacterium]MCF7882544.1 ABC transporter ATP-binding protein [Candidatus Cloacimonadota bacterium]